jgi:tripartite-type tricarboxylate transporter receptor subunit TctC
MFAPKGVSKAIIDRLYRETVEALKQPDVKERYAVVGGAETIGMPPAQFLTRIKNDAARYKQVVQSVGITPQ